MNSQVEKQIDHIREVCARKKPLLVSQTIAYNHEKYLRDTLEGIVMQQTDFPFVAIVHDDASTDGTAEILREYAEKYPDIILPVYEEENQYSKRDGSLGRVIRAARGATGAKYIAMCEGDDYWIDPLKLQKQISFLESHPDYSMVYTGFNTVNAEGKDLYIPRYVEAQEKSVDGDIFKLLLRGNFIQTCTVCYRKDVYYTSIHKNAPYALDYKLFLSLSLLGKCKYLPDITSNYRVLSTGQMLSNGYNVKKMCDTNQRYFADIWMRNFSKNESIMERLHTYKWIGEMLGLQWKHYRSSREEAIKIKDYIRRHSSLWPFLGFGVMSAVKEMIHNKMLKK